MEKFKLGLYDSGDPICKTALEPLKENINNLIDYNASLESHIKFLEDNAFSDRARIGKLETEMELLIELWNSTSGYILRTAKQKGDNV
jgi:hypothetical protein